MDERVKRWLFDPTVGKLFVVVLGMVVVYAGGRAMQRAVARHVTDASARYRARKLVSFGVYVVGISLVATVFSDRLASLTVAFGVAGAGVAFALQEVIASVAGWVVLSFGDCYSPGDPGTFE